MDWIAFSVGCFFGLIFGFVISGLYLSRKPKSPLAE
jgi:hypothetical protein